MSRVVLLDSGPLGMVTNPRATPISLECQLWFDSLESRGYEAMLPEITDYEVRRELLRVGKVASIRRLDQLKAAITYVPDNTTENDLSKRKFLHPEFQAEIEFGNEESKGVEESALLDNLRIFLEHKKDWNAADEAIVSLRDSLQQEKLPAMDKLIAAVPHEVRYQYALLEQQL